MKQIYIVVFIFSALCSRLSAQDVIDKAVDAIQNVELYFKENKTCPDHYKLVYIKCGNDLKPNCIVPEDQTNCNSCWEVHWGPCAGKPSGGMWFYDSFERANRAAYLAASSSSCPWFESSNYMIVLNDPKGCLQKPTGYEMVSWPSPLQLQPRFESIDNIPSLSPKKEKTNKDKSTENNELDDLLNELITDNGLSDDEKTAEGLERLKKQTNELLVKAEEEKKNNPVVEQNNVQIRGLAGKIESGEYDPNKSKEQENKNNTASTQLNQNNKESTNSSSGQGTNSGSSSSNASNCKYNTGTGVFNFGTNKTADACSLFSSNEGCSLKGVYLSSGSAYIKIYNMPTASNGSFTIKDFLKCGNCDLYITDQYGGSYSGTLTKTGPNCFTLTCTMKDAGGKTYNLTASGTYK
jgi:hypothetical protein